MAEDLTKLLTAFSAKLDALDAKIDSFKPKTDAAPDIPKEDARIAKATNAIRANLAGKIVKEKLDKMGFDELVIASDLLDAVIKTDNRNPVPPEKEKTDANPLRNRKKNEFSVEVN